MWSVFRPPVAWSALASNRTKKASLQLSNCAVRVGAHPEKAQSISQSPSPNDVFSYVRRPWQTHAECLLFPVSRPGRKPPRPNEATTTTARTCVHSFSSLSLQLRTAMEAHVRGKVARGAEEAAATAATANREIERRLAEVRRLWEEKRSLPRFLSGCMILRFGDPYTWQPMI